MSCTSPSCYLIPFEGGRPKKLMDDYPVGIHPLGKIVYLPCGGCIACRRERRQELTLLQMAEASMFDDNWFITLTYDDEKYYHDQGIYPYSLVKSHLYKFNESMRKYAAYKGKQYRFFACGEYGEQFERPHYHLSVFGLTPEDLGLADNSSIQDKRKININYGNLHHVSENFRDDNGFEFWQSPIISARWTFGSHKIYRANRETYQYVASYCTKKLSGQLAKDFKATGRVLPFFAQSRPSIGRTFFNEYHTQFTKVWSDKLVNDTLSLSDVDWKIPRIFGRWLEQLDQFDGKFVNDKIKAIRVKEMPEVPDREDLKRKADYDRFAASRYREKNLLHKEIK